MTTMTTMHFFTFKKTLFPPLKIKKFATTMTTIISKILKNLLNNIQTKILTDQLFSFFRQTDSL